MRITGSKVLWGFQLSIAYAKNGDFQKQCLGSLLGFIFSKKLLLQSDGSGRNSRRDRGQQTIFFSCKSSDCAYLQIIKTALWTIPIMKAKENSSQQKWDGLLTTKKTPLENIYIYIFRKFWPNICWKLTVYKISPRSVVKLSEMGASSLHRQTSGEAECSCLAIHTSVFYGDMMTLSLS